MDERRHNMDGALFVDEERATDSRDARARTDARTDERPPRPRSSYDDDGKAEAARRVTQGILDRMDLEARVHIRENDESVVLDIDGPDAGRAIGKKGMTLEALQFLVNKIVNRDPDERRHIVLDSGDYRERHDNGLVSMAKREAKRAVTSGRPVTLEPMSARDRRVIHVSLSKFAGITTRSEGEGMERRLQIIPARGDRAPGDRARDDRPRDDRPRERPERTSERVGDRTVRDDRPRPVAARDDRPRAQARADRPPSTDRDRLPERDRPASNQRDRPVANDRDRPIARERPVANERDRPIARERPAANDRDRPIARERPVANDRDRRIDHERPVERGPLSERERLTERDRPVERSRVAEPRTERDVGPRSYAPAEERDPAAAPRRDYDDRNDRPRGR